MPDTYATHAQGLTAPLMVGFPIQASDTADLPWTTRQIRVTGAAGDIAVIWSSGAQTIEPVQAGETLDWRITRVLATGTTATGIRGYA
jgi:hypothetical protein